jgi:superfamily II DNA or RNA helicase
VEPTVNPLDRVRTATGREGLVRSVDAWPMVEVLFAEGAETLHCEDLEHVAEGPVEELRQGRLGEALPYGLRLQALFLKHAYRFDTRFGLSNARIEPNLHQLFIAHLVTNKLKPRMILADEVGLGKTIEAGLILKELRAREMIERVLIVCPASLQYQWQTELRSKFNEEFEIINSAAAKYLGQGGENPFTRRDSAICSLPFATMPKRAEQILEADWDLVIFDEAHRVRRWLQSGSKAQTTLAYRLADDLKDVVPGLLLLTATPMQLHPFELYSLIELVEPGLYPGFSAYDRRRRDLPRLNDLMRALKGWRVLDAVEQSAVIEKHRSFLVDLLGTVPTAEQFEDDDVRNAAMDALVAEHPQAEAMVRNRKAEIGGFASRTANRLPVPITDEELDLYEEVANYLRDGYNRAQASKQPAIGFLMVTYQKMLASSSYAIHQSLKRRVAKLRRQLAAPATKARPVRNVAVDLLEEMELSEATEEVEDVLDREALAVEIADLERIIARLQHVADSKAEALLDMLEPIFADNPDEKVVIFTQFLETQTYLRAQLEAQGYRVAIFHGSLNADDKEAAVRRFRSDAQILVSTEAGGEGRNLQFAHLLVNYDLPWNPMKVEQRIGRLDRIGQKRPVHIYNLACEGTIEERVLDVLENRIRLFTESVGSLDPILGEVENDIARLVMSHIDRFDEEFTQFAADLDKRTREARENEKVLADFVLDRASLRRDRVNELLGEEPLASYKDLAAFISDTLDYYGGTLKPHIEGGHVVTLSPRLQTRLQTRAPQWRGVFDPQEALALEDLDFFAVGHELVDRIIDLPMRVEPVATSARTLADHVGPPSVEVFYQIRSDGPVPYGRIIRHVVDANAQVVSEEVVSLPALGTGSASTVVPPWVGRALAASRVRFNQELDQARSVVQRQDAIRQADENERARRIFEYRRERLRRRIEEEAAWVEAKERSGSASEQRILPARRGKLEKDRARLERLGAEHEAELAEIARSRPGVSGTVWAAGLVMGP